MPAPNVTRILEHLVEIHLNHVDLGIFTPNQRLVPSKDLNLLNEVRRFQETKVNLKLQHNVIRQWGNEKEFLDKVSK